MPQRGVFSEDRPSADFRGDGDKGREDKREDGGKDWVQGTGGLECVLPLLALFPVPAVSLEAEGCGVPSLSTASEFHPDLIEAGSCRCWSWVAGRACRWPSDERWLCLVWMGVLSVSLRS